MCIIILQIMEEAWNLDFVGIYSVVQVARLVRRSAVFSGEMTMVTALGLLISNTLKIETMF